MLSLPAVAARTAGRGIGICVTNVVPIPHLEYRALHIIYLRTLKGVRRLPEGRVMRRGRFGLILPNLVLEAVIFYHSKGVVVAS